MAEAAEKRTGELIQFPIQDGQYVSMTKSELLSVVQQAIANSQQKPLKIRKTKSLTMDDGRRKPTPADPIRTKNDFDEMVKYLSENGRPAYRLRNKTIFVLGCSLGLRCGDLLDLKTSDVFTKQGYVKPHVEIIEQKTRKRNVCKIPEMAVRVLYQYKAEQKFEINDDTYLFGSRKGGRLNVRSVYAILKNAGQECGFDMNMSTHTMRKTYAMAALSNAEKAGMTGQTLEMLQMKLNHSDARITMRYCKAAQDKMDKMSDSVSDWFTNEN
jgi:integrase